MKIWTDFLVFWGLRKPTTPPTELELYRDEWERLLVKLACHRVEERMARSLVEATADRIDMLESLMSAYPAQQSRLSSAYQQAKESQNGENL